MEAFDADARRPRSTRGKALVLGRDSRGFLAVVRSLGRRGIEVHVAWHDPEGVAARSRYIAAAHVLPECSGSVHAWKSALFELIERERFDFVLPTNDATIVALHACRREVERRVCIHLPSARSFAIAFDKLETWKLARSLSIPVPEQVLVTDVAQASLLAATLGWPIVLEPRNAYAFGRTKWEHWLRKAYDPRELVVQLHGLLAKDQVLAQRAHPGHGVGVDVLARDGEVLMAFQHERVHEPPTGGGSSYRKSVALDPALFEAASRLMEAIEHTGVATIEFKLDPASGAWVLIDIKLRCSDALPLALAAGADFPAQLQALAVDGRHPEPRAYRTGIYCRNLWLDLAWLMQLRGVDRHDPTVPHVSTARLLGELGHVLSLRERSDTLVLDDPRPGLVELGRTLRELALVPLNKLRKLPLRSRFVRTRMARAQARELAAAKRVLFVCRDNLCRSPFAASYARAILPPPIEVFSAGYHAQARQRAPREAVEVARAFGVELAEHRSRVIDEALLASCDLVFVHDERDRRALATRFPDYRAKLRRVGTLSARGAPDIRDPYGRRCGDFEASYAAIARALRCAAGLAEAPLALHLRANALRLTSSDRTPDASQSEARTRDTPGVF